MRKIRIAQIGTEHDHAYMAFKALGQLTDDFELVGFANPDTKREHFPVHRQLYDRVKEYSVEELLALPNLDAVAIETEDPYLVKYAQMAADRGLHVYMDKPGSQQVEDFERLLSTVKKQGKVFSIGYMYRYNPIIREVLESAKAGKYGEIFSVEAQMNCWHPKEKRQWLGKFKGGMNFYLGCHLIDLVLQLQGVPERILPLNCSTGFDGVDSEDFGMAVLEYKNGVSFVKTTAAEVDGYNRRQLVVCGQKGAVEIKPLEEAHPEEYVKTYATEKVAPEGANGWSCEGRTMQVKLQRYEGMLKEFAKCVREGKQGGYSLEYEATLHRAILCACGIECDYKAKIEL